MAEFSYSDNINGYTVCVLQRDNGKFTPGVITPPTIYFPSDFGSKFRDEYDALEEAQRVAVGMVKMFVSRENYKWN